MDINKLNNVNNKNLNKTNGTSEGEASQKASSKSSVNSTEDKVSIDDYKFRNNDKLFAEIELEKLNESSSRQFKEMKSQVSEFLKASEQSPEAAQETEMGQKINDPEVWGDIANKILQ